MYSAARNFLRVYDATIAFAGLTDSDTVVGPSDDRDDDSPPPPKVKVGDLVQIEVNGSLVLPQPKRVRAIQEHDGQDWIFIEGSETGFEMSQAILQEAAPAPKMPPRLPVEPPAPTVDTARLPEGWSEETLIDDDGSEIKVRYHGKATLDRYKFIRDYLDFKIGRLEPKSGKAANDAKEESA